MSAAEAPWYGEWISTNALPANVRAALDAPNLATILEAKRRHAPTKRALTCLTDGDGEQSVHYDYETLVSAIFATARALRALGQTAEKPVLFLGLPTADGLIAYWGAQIFGPVWPVNPMLSLDQLRKLASSMPVSAVVAPTATLSADVHAKARALTEALNVSFVVADRDADHGLPALPLLARGEPDHFPTEGLPSHGDIVACFPTGGTTGLPKVALLSQRNQIAGIAATALIHDPSENIVTANGLPVFHVGGGVIATTRALVLGQTLIQMSPAGFRSRGVMNRFWEITREHAISQIIAVPTVFADMLDVWPGGDCPVRYFIAGASKLPENLNARYLKQFGVGVHEGYGMTECSGFATANAIHAPPRPGSAGRQIPFYEVRTAALDDAGGFAHWCGIGERGRVLIRGPAVFSGYSDARATRDKFVDCDGDAWLDSGDIGSIDANGDLWLTGRHKDVIIRGGHNIDAATIEDCLMAHPDVIEAAAVGMPDARLGELPIAFAATGGRTRLTETELLDFTRQRIEEPAATPVRIVMMDGLPRTAMNKIFKPELRRLALQMAIAPFIDSPGRDANVTVLLDDNGDLCVHLPTAAATEMTDLVEFLARVSVRSSVLADTREGANHD